MTAAKKTQEHSKTYREQECKLNARSVGQLRRVRKHIIDDSHYVTLNDEKFLPDVMKGGKMLGVPESFTPPRIRVYYDDVNLHGFCNGVEIRVELKPQSLSDEDRYKQVIKIGNNTTDDDGIFDRIEFPARLDDPAPDLGLSNLDGKQKKKLKDIFEVKDLSKIRLLPLIQIVSQRWRIEFHPDGKRDTRIEYAHDFGIGQTFTGFTWKMYQAELELKNGGSAALMREKKRLMETFNFFTPGMRSKPSAGFDVLSAALSREGINKAARKVLVPGEFKVLKKVP